MAKKRSKPVYVNSGIVNKSVDWVEIEIKRVESKIDMIKSENKNSPQVALWTVYLNQLRQYTTVPF